MIITYIIKIKSLEKLCLAYESIKDRISLNHIISRTIRSFPGRKKVEETTYYCLRDYFDNIELINESHSSFSLVFYPKSNASSFWKDLMINILGFLRNSYDAEIEITKPNPS